MDNKNFHGVASENEGRLLSKAIKAGRRTYFMDVHSTRGGDDYIVITESRKHTTQEGKVHFDRHRIFLYKEDFEKFNGGLEEVINFIRQRHPDYFENQQMSDIDREFEDL